MKRSQMVQQIVSVLRDTYLLGEQSQAQAVLAKIEELGMKPPVEAVDPILFQTQHVWGNENE